MAACVRLELLPGQYAVSRLDGTEPIPAWADGAGFVSISRSADELSIVCLQARVPGGVKSEGGWVCLQLVGPLRLRRDRDRAVGGAAVVGGGIGDIRRVDLRWRFPPAQGGGSGSRPPVADRSWPSPRLSRQRGMRSLCPG